MFCIEAYFFFVTVSFLIIYIIVFLEQYYGFVKDEFYRYTMTMIRLTFFSFYNRRLNWA